jgi:HK97 family phage major capsid protein
MAAVKEWTRTVIRGVEHIVMGGRVMPIVAGGEPTIEEHRARLTEIQGRLQELDTEFAGQALPEAARAEWNQLGKERDETTRLIEELEARLRVIGENGNDPGRSEPGASFETRRPGAARGEDIYDLSTVRASVSDPAEATREMRDRALRSVEAASFPHERAERERCRAHIERLLDLADPEDGAFARHLLVTGSPTYKRAFGKALAGRPLSSEELRALSLTTTEGGFAVPYQLDPTIIPTSNHSVNPYRAISRVETIVTNEWRGVTSAGVTASYAAEGDEATDDAPELAQPSVTPERAQAFIPFSIEIGQDWSGLQAEMARLLQDAKDDLEATKFTTGAGSGSDEPEGVVTGATTTLDTAAAAAFGVADVYATEEALPPRFRPLAQWVANRAIYNKVRQFDTAGGADLWLRLPQGLANQVPTPGNTGAELIGYSANEASAMSAQVAAGNKIAILGDFRYYLIVDRVGMAVELVPHLFGSNRRPTGQRGLYAIWRNSAEVLSPAAFRVLKVKAP